MLRALMIASLGTLLLVLPSCKREPPTSRPVEPRHEKPKPRTDPRPTHLPAPRPAPAPPLSEAQRKKLEVSHAAAIHAFVKPPTSAPAQDPATLIARVVETKGGMAKLRALKTLIAEHTIAQAGTPPRIARVAAIYPDKLRAETYVKGKIVSTILILGHRVFIKRGRHFVPLREAQRRHVVRLQMTDSYPFLIAASAPGAKLRYVGMNEVRGAKCHVVELRQPGYSVTAYIDAASFDLVGVTLFSGLAYVTSLESDFKPVGGLRFAHKTKLLIGKNVIDSTTTKLELDKPLPPILFTVKP
ncbi:MAG: hypothetical protein KC609_07430 [Myxococcales bacterium]|nr:hypothetical protein [Myxococcales bacterium]